MEPVFSFHRQQERKKNLKEKFNNYNDDGYFQLSLVMLKLEPT